MLTPSLCPSQELCILAPTASDARDIVPLLKGMAPGPQLTLLMKGEGGGAVLVGCALQSVSVWFLALNRVGGDLGKIVFWVLGGKEYSWDTHFAPPSYLIFVQ